VFPKDNDGTRHYGKITKTNLNLLFADSDEQYTIVSKGKWFFVVVDVA